MLNNTQNSLAMTVTKHKKRSVIGGKALERALIEFGIVDGSSTMQAELFTAMYDVSGQGVVEHDEFYAFIRDRILLKREVLRKSGKFMAVSSYATEKWITPTDGTLDLDVTYFVLPNQGEFARRRNFWSCECMFE